MPKIVSPSLISVRPRPKWALSTATPAERLSNKLTAELRAMADEPDYQKKLYAQGNVPWNIGPAQLIKVLADDIKRLGDRLKSSGVNLVE